MSRDDFAVYIDQLAGWDIIDDKKLTRTVKFKDFPEAVKFVNDIALIAQKEDHHPDINLHNWNKVTLTLSTHAVGGLSINDFILGAKVNRIMMRRLQ